MSEQKRAPIQAENGHPRGTISWEEHLEIWLAYDKKYHCGQSAERIAERGGFGYTEATELVGRELRTWIARDKK